LAQLYELLQTATINRVEILEPANSATPIASQIGLKVMVGVLVGLLLSFLVVFAFESWSNTINDIDGLARAGGVPILGAIAKHKRLRGVGRERIAVQALPQSNAAENYRMLGTKLLHSNDYGKLRSVLLSTADPSGDSGELVANLAIILSQTGSRVVLVDANLHHPTLEQIFDIVDRPGLTDVLTDQVDGLDLTPIDWAPGLSVLPSGQVTHDSFALLASPRMTHLLSRLEEMTDIVIVVASSVLSFADSLFLTNSVDGVILVARSGKTPGDKIQNAISNLRMVGAPILGMVLLNSRKGSVQEFQPLNRRSAIGRQTQPRALRANGHKKAPSQAPQIPSESGGDDTVPTRLTQPSDER
jgi:non-specific protein-tyrosine kinase